MAKNCKNVLTHGQCNNRTCPFEHKILICDPCDYIAPHKDAWKNHLEGKKHRDIVSGKAKTSHCNICQRSIVGGPQQWAAHVGSQKHRKLAATQQVDADVERQDGASTEKQEFCSLCQVSVWKSAWSRHLERPGHVQREKSKVALDEAEKDKNGISVEGDFSFDIVDPTTAGNGIQSTVTVTTSLPFSKTILAEVNMASSYNRRDAFSRSACLSSLCISL
jgi:helicase MOV-10